MERQFLERGLERAETARDAEVVVLNTCTVTEGADKDARAAIRRLQRENPGCQILVTGCYAQRAPEELAALPGVRWVVGNSHKHEVAKIATSGLRSIPLVQIAPASESGVVDSEFSPNIVIGDIFAHTELMAAPVFEAANERTRPNLKVQDGCDNRCSFCVIPYVRGQSRSLPQERVITEVNALVAAGYREVVISGINLGRWGRDILNGRLVDLIRAILDRTALEKLRISSVEPMDWSDELVDLVAQSPRIAQHAHVPMQSGSDAVLRRMHRKYRPWHYRDKVVKIRDAMRNAAIGADVMVGFPGETEVEFEETKRMVDELPFTYLHVFTYSARPGTSAADRPDQVPLRVARERNRVLRELASCKQAAFKQSLVGSVIEAITLRSNTDEFTEALTDNYLKIRIEGRHDANQWIPVRLKSASTGEVASRHRPGSPESGAVNSIWHDTEVTLDDRRELTNIIDLQPVTG